MFKNLSPRGIGVSGRQSELIELALTYGFEGFNVDMAQIARQAASRGREMALQYIQSAPITVGEWELPVRWQGEQAHFAADMAKLDAVLDMAVELEAPRCFTVVQAASDERSFQENFEFHQQRLGEVAAKLAEREVRLGLAFHALPLHAEGKAYQFINTAEALVTLATTMNAPNVGLVVDLWNWHLGEGKLDQLRDLPVERIVSVRLADIPDDKDPAKLTEQDRLMPGETKIAKALELIQHLIAIEYDGPVTPWPHGSQYKGSTRDRIVQMAQESMLALWIEAGLAEAVVEEPEPVAVAAEGEEGGEGEGSESETPESGNNNGEAEKS